MTAPTLPPALRNAALLNMPAMDLEAIAARAFSKTTKGPDMDEILEALGLTENAGDGETLAAITSLMTGLSDIAVAAGLDKTAEVTAVAASVADLAKAAKSTEPDPAKYVPIEQVSAMQADLKSLRDTIQSDKAEELVSAAIEAGKLAPALKGWGLELARADLKQFEAFTANAPALTVAQLGTEHAMRDPVPSGARVVLIDTALTQADVPLSDRGITRNWTYGPAPLPSTDTTFKERSNTLQAVALKPFSPVHLRGKRDAAGNLSISWIRRTRRDGTWADGTDVPLTEDSELYELEVLNGSTVVRTAAALTAPAYTYSAADQTADFGSTQASIIVRVTQVSGTVGRGTPEEKTL
ncbi:MAG: phage protease [Roseibium sp.]